VKKQNLNCSGAESSPFNSLAFQARALLSYRDSENLVGRHGLRQIEFKAFLLDAVLAKIKHAVGVEKLFRVVVDADTGSGKVANVIAVGNKEHAILFDRGAKLFAEFVSPERRVVGPVAGPLLLAPRVAHLEESNLLALMLKLVDTN
jgi:hypothetical protein